MSYCRYGIIFLALIFMPACRRETSLKDLAITRVFLTENRLLDGYFTTDIDQAQKSLNTYLVELARIDVPNDDDAKKMFYFGQAVALARLEFLIASKGEHLVDLHGAISALRLSNSSYGKLTERKMAEELIEIVRGDVGAVPWLKNFDALSLEALTKVGQTNPVMR